MSKPKTKPKTNGTAETTSKNKVFWTAMTILILLFILSLVILSIQLYSFVTLDKRVLALKSNMDAGFDVFSVEYDNAAGEVTVSGNEGEKVIAPGTSVEYTVRLRNADKIALDYDLFPKAEFHSEYEIPIFVRVIGPDDTYIAGDAKSWVPLDELNGSSGYGTLLVGESVEYVFQWKWPFESGDDAYDTFLGDNVYEESIGVTVAFHVLAEANTDVETNGGLFGEVYSDTTSLVIFTLLLLLAIVILLIYKLRKRGGDAPLAPASTSGAKPKRAPAVATAVAKVAEKSKKAFMGKMEFVNIDTLSEHFEDGDTVTLEKLKALGIVPQSTKQVKILARGADVFDKAFNIETQGISADARTAIIKAGGSVTITDGKDNPNPPPETVDNEEKEL